MEHADREKWVKAVEATVIILKREFPNLTVEKTIKLAHEIAWSVVKEIQ